MRAKRLALAGATLVGGLALGGLTQAVPAQAATPQATSNQAMSTAGQPTADDPSGCITWRSAWTYRHSDGSLSFGQQANAQCDSGKYRVKAVCDDNIIRGKIVEAPATSLARCSYIPEETIAVVPAD